MPKKKVQKHHKRHTKGWRAKAIKAYKKNMRQPKPKNFWNISIPNFFK